MLVRQQDWSEVMDVSEVCWKDSSWTYSHIEFGAVWIRIQEFLFTFFNIAKFHVGLHGIDRYDGKFHCLTECIAVGKATVGKSGCIGNDLH